MNNKWGSDTLHRNEFAQALRREGQVVGRIMNGGYKIIKGKVVIK